MPGRRSLLRSQSGRPFLCESNRTAGRRRHRCSGAVAGVRGPRGDGLPAPPTARTVKRRRATPATAKHRTRATAPDGARAPAPANPVAVAVLRFLLLSGWREREALTLRWDAVDLGRGVATLADTKTGRSVRELGAPALAVVDAMRAHRKRSTWTW